MSRASRPLAHQIACELPAQIPRSQGIAGVLWGFCRCASIHERSLRVFDASKSEDDGHFFGDAPLFL